MPIIYGSKLSEECIHDLESKYSVSIPKDYINFFINYNGFCVEDPDFFDIPYDGVDGDAIDFNCLFGCNIKNKYWDMAYSNDEFLDELSFIEHALIIGGDAGGNFYVLVTHGENTGVYYWDRTHLHVYDTKQNYAIAEVNECGNLYRLSDSFGTFFNLILSLTKDKGVVFTQSLEMK